jgi:hypothetical protein
MMLDRKGRAWLTAAVRGRDNPAFCKEGSDHPSAKLSLLKESSRQLAMLDPKTMKYTFIDTCFGTHRPQTGLGSRLRTATLPTPSFRIFRPRQGSSRFSQSQLRWRLVSCQSRSPLRSRPSQALQLWCSRHLSPWSLLPTVGCRNERSCSTKTTGTWMGRNATQPLSDLGYCLFFRPAGLCRWGNGTDDATQKWTWGLNAWRSSKPLQSTDFRLDQRGPMWLAGLTPVRQTVIELR